MDQGRVAEIVDRWMIRSPGVAYMAGIEGRPVFARALGVRVFDTAGRAYLDFGSGQMAAAIGHNHPRYVETVRKSLETISHASKTFLNVDRLRLHERLGEVLTPPLQKSLFLVSGSDAVEAAVDMARKVTGGIDVLGLHIGLHGSTSFVTRSLSFGWNRSKHPLIAQATASIFAPFCYRCPIAHRFPDCGIQCLASSFELAEANFTGKPAAVIMEPVMSAGGIVVPPPGFVARLKAMCAERGMLLILDESQTGLGKTGRMWGHQHEDVVPDIITVSKHFGAGLPISAVCTTAEIADRATAAGYFATRSHAADPILCAAGVASIDIIEEEGLVARAATIETRQRAALEAMARRHGFIGDIRGRGVLFGVELVLDERRTPANELARKVVAICQDKGLLVQARGSHGRTNVVRLVPPMVCSDAEIDEGMAILDAAFGEAARTEAAAERRAS
jgi:2,2-dialkylglycine decarboxylase (pyruvate)